VLQIRQEAGIQPDGLVTRIDNCPAFWWQLNQRRHRRASRNKV
jgi:hypothetical protein